MQIGRQTIESIMLASNDTKMIPNTFEAAVVENKDLPGTTVRAGYIMSQKLRDHQSFHSLIAYEKYNANDDSGAHKGLTPANIRARGAGDVGDGWKLTPGIRYLRQTDDGAGAIGGASLSGNVVSTTAAKRDDARANYTDPHSVDGNILMTRLALSKGALELQAAYAEVANEADIIAPWRGFPTGGYVRSMAQVDWIANTKSWALKAAYDFGKAGVIRGLKVVADYENMNFDDAKAYTSGFTDRDIFHVDVWKTFKEVPNTEFKFRFATVNADNGYTSPGVQGTNDYASYDEYRFEVNYLF